MPLIVRALAIGLCVVGMGCGSGKTGEHGQLLAPALSERSKTAWELEGERMEAWDRAALLAWRSDCGRCTRFVEQALWLQRDGRFALYEVQGRRLRGQGQASAAQLARLTQLLEAAAYQRAPEGPSVGGMSAPHFELRGGGKRVRRLEGQPLEPVIAALRAVLSELMAQAAAPVVAE